MADEEHEETGEPTAPDTETVEDEARTDAEPSGVEDAPGDTVEAEPAVTDEEPVAADAAEPQQDEVQLEAADDGDEEETATLGDVTAETVDEPPPEAVAAEQAVTPEDVPPETVDEPPPEAAAAEQAATSEDVPLETVDEPPAEGVAAEQAATPEDVPPETVDEPQPDAAAVDESGGVMPEPESGGEPLEEAGSPEGDVQQQQLDTVEGEVVVPAVTDEEPVTAESAEPPEGAADEVVDDAYRDSAMGRPSDTEDEGMGLDELGKDVQQSAEQLADQPCEVMPYPSADEIDVLGEEEAGLIPPEPDLDELADLDKADEPDPTRASDRIGPIQECPEIPVLPALLTEGRDDIETPTDESKVPSVLVCFLFIFV